MMMMMMMITFRRLGRGTKVRELGAFEKQSSMVFLAKTCAAHIHRNVFFNGPRAGVSSTNVRELVCNL